MTWLSPIGFELVPTIDSESFRSMPWWPRMTTGIPLSGHVGSFGHVRRHHVHEGVDLYCPNGTSVYAVEAGVIVAIEDFTGPSASPPSPWWNATKAVLVEGESGVVVYGEINPLWPDDCLINQVPSRTAIHRGAQVGWVTPVLRKDKERPTSMLHIELHRHGTRCTYEWPVSGPRPESLLDPTEKLLVCERW